MAPSKQWMQLVDNRLDETYLVGEPLSKSEHEDEDEDENGNAVEECESEDEVEELLRDLYPNHDGGTTNTDCDDLLEEEPNVEENFLQLIKGFQAATVQKFKSFKTFHFD
ncbi:hypothetical protein H5410_036353 [Solanum commersonii]|uniref:Uncharacterized protein n=1 Tax=Solanum commersonii TaxID=4109 RepID=A0A9J5Y3Y6_SOLCO|nr:hypothetical protein H5410_036353 [Solanum commersonii]